MAWLVLPPPGQAAPDPESVVVNGLLAQNLVHAPSPDRSFWSIAVEAQLYVLFPLLLLMGAAGVRIVMVATVTLVVATVGILGPHVSPLDVFVIQSPPDLAALFAVGVLAAGIAGAGESRRSWPWAWLALAAAAPVLATMSVAGFGVDARPPVLGRPHAGSGRRVSPGRPCHRPSRTAAARCSLPWPIRSLGASSYSLYRTHGPIVVVVYEKVVAGRVREGVPAFIASLALALPLTIAVRTGLRVGLRERRRSHPADSGTSSVCAPRRAFVAR